MLKAQFIEVINRYENEQRIIEPMWAGIVTHYSAEDRHYHNLHHLQKMLEHLLAVKNELQDWNVVILALCYHDIIYDPLQNNNEEESAALARRHLSTLAMHPAKVKRVVEMILATKKHELSPDNDVNYFIDADLSILGADEHAYDEYAANIRKEYALVPDALYIPGRISILDHFLQMPTIFKTTHFKNRLEEHARKNLEREKFRLLS